jgi:hypothetical protein
VQFTTNHSQEVLDQKESLHVIRRLPGVWGCEPHAPGRLMNA